MKRSEIFEDLERLAPPEGAAEWDNTGLLIHAQEDGPCRRVLLTLDLTAGVVEEAVRTETDVILAYHPPIFSGLKSLGIHDPASAHLLELVRNGIDVYCPHTALDAAPDGVSDWLCAPFENAEIEPVEGSGRLITFQKKQSMVEITRSIQSHCEPPYLRMASPPGRTRKIKTLAICPGAGASILKEMEAEAVFTGEMRHHDILSFIARGVHVILSEHGHTERPYLHVLLSRLKERWGESVEIRCSRKDREPLTLIKPDA